MPTDTKTDTNLDNKKNQYCITRESVYTLRPILASRKHAYIILAPLNPTFIY